MAVKNHLYWATGCTSCLRVKEFLERNDVPFVSHNVIKSDGAAESSDRSQPWDRGVDEAIIDEMRERGLPDHTPIVRRGDEWADGKDLGAVSQLIGIDYDADPLPVEELRDRLSAVLDATQRFLELLPERELETAIPNRPRSYADLVQHIFEIPDVFIMHEAGVPEPDTPENTPRMVHDWDHTSKVALSTYGSSVQGRLAAWFDGPGRTCDWSETADVFWGRPTKHGFLERTTWHAGQHVRQLQWILTEELGNELEDPLSRDIWEGLPMPEKVWDAEA